MPLEPLLADLLASQPLAAPPTDIPAARAANLAQSRALIATVAEPGPVVASTTRVSVPVDGGTVEADVYQPLSEGPHPVHLFFHGGGWVLGSIDDPAVQIACQERSAGADCVVVAVNYRKAPEHPYPTALYDCRTALDWVVDHADELQILTDVITIGGQSAGANLTAALALQVRDTNGPPIRLQVLDVPSLDFTFSSPSITEFATGYGITEADLHWYRDQYLTDLSRVHDPYVSPLLAPDLTGLPPAVMMASEYDPLRDDATRYAQRLHSAGIPATVTVLAGHIHGSSVATLPFASARAWRTEVIEGLKHAHLSS